MPSLVPDIHAFRHLAAGGANLIPLVRRLMGDALTPVLVYRRLVRPDDRLAPSFLLESVVDGDRLGRFSYLGAQPIAQVIARGHQVTVLDARGPDAGRIHHSDDPLREMDKLTSRYRPARPEWLPEFAGGWVGMAGYDSVRYLEGEKLPDPPRDDRGLPDLHFGLYRQIVAFDHVSKTVLAITHVLLDEHDTVEEAYEQGKVQLEALVQRIRTPAPGLPELPVGEIDLHASAPALVSSMVVASAWSAA